MKAFVVNKISDKEFVGKVEDVSMPICEEDEVIIKVNYSSLNYKDALSSVGNPGVTRNFPHITGIDLAGTIYESKSNIFKENERVVVTGYDLGMNTDGGHAQFVKVPASWVARIPDTLSDKEIMTFGTAGLTAALSINELIRNSVNPKDGNILVTGSTGGVGSISVSILSKLGYKVTAISSKEEKIDYLKRIGASEVILKDTFIEETSKKPILKEKYAGIIDTVGGVLLANALKCIKYDGVATCCGLAASHELNTNVFPFILRGVRLIGIDSVECKLEKKQEAWNKLGGIWKIDTLDNITNEISLDELQKIYNLFLAGRSVGRYVVKID